MLRMIGRRQSAPPAAIRMAPADAAWLHADELNNPADIVLLMTFDESPTFEAVQDTATRRLLRFDRFRQRVVEVNGRPYWESDGDFAIGNHVSRMEIDGPLTAECLAGVVADLASNDMPPERPPWAMQLVTGAGRLGAVVLRVHHCIGDGFALARAVSFPAGHRNESTSVANDPKPTSRQTGKATGLARTVGHMLRAPFGRETVVRGNLSGRRRVAWSAGFSLEAVKGVARSRGATLNDVFMAAITGMLRSFLAERGELGKGRSVRAIVPVSLRPARRVEEADDSLGNRFGLFFVDLPVEEKTARRRWRTLAKRLRTGNRLTEAAIALGMLRALGRGPAWVDRVVSHVFARKASVVISNVPGPWAPVYFGDKEIKEVMFWAPHPGKLGMSLSILTYAGTVRMGARADVAVVDDPRRLVELFEAELSVILKVPYPGREAPIAPR